MEKYQRRVYAISTHDLARRSTLAIVRDEQVCYYFNSRPHEEVDSLPSAKRPAYNHFNSRPHKEVDAVFMLEDVLAIVISTHDLARRSTTSHPLKKSGAIFQLTTSRRGRPGNCPGRGGI